MRLHDQSETFQECNFVEKKTSVETSAFATAAAFGLVRCTTNKYLVNTTIPVSTYG